MTTQTKIRSAKTVYTQSGKDSQLTDDELREKYKDLIAETTLYYRLRHITKLGDLAFNLLENIVYSQSIKKPLDAPIFPLGNFRSGTSFLEKVITDHPTIGSFVYASQVFPCSPLVTKLAMTLVPAINSKMLPIHMPSTVDTQSPYEGEPIWRQCKNNCWTDHPVNVLDADFSDPHFEKTFQYVANKHLISQNKSRFVNKNPWNTLRVGYLAKLYPDAKFVYIIRNPYRMLRSQIDLEGVHERTLGHLKDYNEVFSDQFAAPREFFRTTNSQEYIDLYKTDRALATAMSIADFDATFDHEVEKGGLEDRIHRVRYEDLVAHFAAQMTEVFEFLDLHDDDGKEVIATNEAQYLRKDLVSSKSELPRYNDDIEAVLRPLAEKHGYLIE